MIQYDYQTRVYYKDIDKMGVVYYSRYFEFFEQARTELFNEIGINIKEIENEDCFLPVVSTSCDYHQGAKFEDQIIVRALIKAPPSARMTIDYEVYRKRDKKLLVTGKTVHGFINKRGIPKKPPKSLKLLISTLLSD